MSLSEEQLVDCDIYDGGCQGGLQETAFQYLAQSGSVSEADYPYTAGSGFGGSCKASQYPVAATVKYYSQVNSF